jgi:TonB family protein
VAETETESETESESETVAETEFVTIEEFDDLPEEVAETVFGDGASTPPVYTPSPGTVVWRVKVPPRYPIKARRLGVSGEIVLLVTFDERGVPGNIRLLEGPDMFINAAVNAVEQWRADPIAGDDGWPIPFRQRIRLRFTLR